MKRAPQVLSLLLLLMLMTAPRQTVDATSATFSFAVGGDHSANSKATSSLDLLANSGVDFYLALGDMSYTAGFRTLQPASRIRSGTSVVNTGKSIILIIPWLIRLHGS